MLDIQHGCHCPDNGRDSVPPSLLATALLLQTYDKVSDAEAKARADFDIRWKVALGIEIEDRPFAKSTLQMFRAQLILHDQVREVFESSLTQFTWIHCSLPSSSSLDRERAVL